MRIRQPNVFFDLWGTLVYSDPVRDYRGEMIGISGLSPEEFDLFVEENLFRTPISLSDFARMLCKTPTDKRAEKELLQLLVDRSVRAFTFPDTHESLRALRGRHNLFLVSDCGAQIRELVGKIGLSEYFDRLYLSYEVGKTKRTGLYRHVLMELRCEPGECFVIGDSVTRDYKIPLELGMQAALLDRNNSRGDFSKVSSLRELT